MNNSADFYKVKILVGSAYDDVVNPEFLFNPDEKEKMLNFIDVCIENGHEVSIVKDDLNDD